MKKLVLYILFLLLINSNAQSNKEIEKGKILLKSLSKKALQK